MVGSPQTDAHLAAALEQAPAPELALGFVEKLVDGPSGSALRSLSGERLADLCFLLGASPALARRLVASGPAWPELFARIYQDHAAPLPTLAGGTEQRQAGLARHVADEMLRIGGRELVGLSDTHQATEQLSGLAAEVIGAAHVAVREAMAEEGRVPVEAGGRPLGFVVLGLGKLGGGELNYSSDVDLIYLHEDAPGPAGAMVAPYFDQMAKRLTGMLAGTGYPASCFRVDMRLRPYGRDGPLVCSARAALDYYRRAGETWERGALIKARPVAGDLELGERFIEEVAPFIYRRHLDYRTAEDLRRMKSRIDLEQGRGGPELRDVKTGPGGIREIEFVTQLLQLVHGSHEPVLRCRGTVRALELLEERRLIGTEQAQGLHRAYGFLRQVEHAVQVVEQRQTHSLPTAAEGLRQLARRLGYGTGRRGRPLGGDERAAFERDWSAHTRRVRETFLRYHELRPGGPGQSEAASDPLGAALFEHLGAGRLRGASELLEQLGFGDGERAAAALARLQTATGSDAGGQRTRALAAMVPSLVEAAAISSDPQSSLDKLVDFLVRAGAHTSYAALLGGSGSAMRILAVLFSSSPYLAGLLVGRPELLDWLARSADHQRQPGRDELAAELARRLDPYLGEDPTDEEAVMAELRQFRSGHLVRIGMADLGASLDDEGRQEQLSLLAEVTLAAALDAAAAILRMRQPEAPWNRLELAVLALGKLGGAEMSYGSDLDLIFVYDTGRSDYDADCHSLATRWAQRTLALLQTRTRDGIAYQVDTRLRPSGSSGPLVVSLARFAEYHSGEAALWERQAHIKGRVVYGPAGLGEQIERLRQDFVYGAGLDSTDLAEIDHMRRRMEAELARESSQGRNIKSGRGALADVDFLAQMLGLGYGGKQAVMRQRCTPAILAAAAESGLLGAGEAATLIDDYRFLRRLESRLRLERDRPVERLGGDARSLEPLAVRLGFIGRDAGAELLAHYDATCERVRAAYERRFGQPR